jgi:hypothetical protein
MITWSADDKINTADPWDDFDGWADGNANGRQPCSGISMRPAVRPPDT